ncbi:MAG: TIGR01906 family membrane protein [Clostridia bacterium]|nr:TIGR01906 family membrane protein [Clostridia bacterium]
MKSKPVSVTLSVIFVIALAALIITGAIAIPIYCRFFYYWQIKPLGLEEVSGASYEEIKEAYNLLLNYLTLPGREFSVGVFKCSESAIAHFDDCKFLFNLNLGVLVGSTAVIIVLGVLSKLKIIRICRPHDHSMCTIGALVSVLLPVLVIIAFAAVGWDRGYELFHNIMFPGKDNWQFSWTADSIIQVLPDEFFMNCAILIGCAIVAADIGLVIYDVESRKRRRLKNIKPENGEKAEEDEKNLPAET